MSDAFRCLFLTGLQFSNTLSKMVAGLKIVKGEMKYCHRRFVDQKLKLERELQTAHEQYIRSMEVRSRVKSSYEETERQHRLSSVSASTMTQIQLERHSNKL